MEKIYAYIENNDDCQFTLAELKDVCKNFIPDEKTIKSKLIERYGEKIVITIKNISLTSICFIHVQHDFLNKAKKSNEKKERLRILETAAAIIIYNIIREDIRSVIVDNTSYK